jgi:hypothetical protein
VLGVAIVCLLAWAGPALALSYDGKVSVEYSGTRDQSFVYDPTNPAVWQGTLHLVFDEKTTVALYGREQDTPTTKILSHSQTISGTWTNTYAPPNQAMTCTGNLSARPGAPSPFDIYFGSSDPPAVGVTAQLPDRGFEIQSSAPESGQCGVMNQAGGPGFVAPDSVIEAEVPASPAQATVTVPSNDYSKSYSASGSDRQVTESFHATLQVSTSGSTSGPSAPRRTAAQIEAKRNALQALQQSAPASLYPCFSTAAGATLLATGLPGQIAGGTLLVIAGPLCAAYNAMIQAEVQTINDPPRSDYGALVHSPRARPVVAPTVSCKGVPPAATRACHQARSAAQTLLARSRTAAQLAKAIEVTISRESGAERAHKTGAAARQNRKLVELNKSFTGARRLERTAGSSLARALRAYHVVIRMTASEVQTAESGLLSALRRHKMTAADVAVVKRVLRGRTLNILNTLGR